MKYISLILGLLFFLSYAQEVQESNMTTVTVSRSDIKIMEATENIRYLSQEMAKHYLFLFVEPVKVSRMQKLKQSIINLNKNIRTIQLIASDDETKNMLDFLLYSQDQIVQIVAEKPTKSNAALMLDYSETLLEGADSIARKHRYHMSKEESMLILTKKTEFLLERMMKYYLALHTGFASSIYQEQMLFTQQNFDKAFGEIVEYDYPQTIETLKMIIRDGWYTQKKYFLQSDQTFIAKLMDISNNYLIEGLRQIEYYHYQKQ